MPIHTKADHSWSGKIKSNKAKCLICGDIIESKRVHHFVWCTCGNLAVDGGTSYIKRGFKSDNWEEMSEYEK